MSFQTQLSPSKQLGKPQSELPSEALAVAVGASPVFLDKKVFDEDYLPDRILHRNSQVATMTRILADLKLSVRPGNILTTGAFGSGKTLLVKATCRNLPSGSVFVYLNCSKENTRLRILRATLSQLGASMVESGFPGDYYERRFEHALAQHKFVILALDEVDKFTQHKGSESFELFYMLSRLIGNVTVILLTNLANFENEFANNMDARVRDTFRWSRIEFPDYDALELTDIIEDRCRVGLKSTCYDRGVCAQVARLAYNQGGRARGALALMRKAAEVAESFGHEKIAEADVQEAARELREKQGQENIRQLPPIERKLLGYVLMNNPTGVAAYKWFVEVAKQHQAGTSLASFYGYLGKLQTLGLLDKEKHGRGRAKGLNMILHVPSEMIEEVCLSLGIQEDPPLLR